MKFLATLTTLVICLQAMSVNGFQPMSKKASIMPLEKEASSISVSEKSLGDAINRKALTGFASATVWMMNMGIDPAFAADTTAKPDYAGKEFTAQFLPAVMVPLVGLVFPAISMALFFLYSQKDDIETA